MFQINNGLVFPKHIFNSELNYLTWHFHTLCWYYLAWHSPAHNSFHKCICFAYSSGVKPIDSVVWRTETILPSCSHVPHVAQALGDSRLIVGFPLSHASFFWSLVSLSSCIQRVFSTSFGTPPPIWNGYAEAPDQFFIINDGCARLDIIACYRLTCLPEESF